MAYFLKYLQKPAIAASFVGLFVFLLIMGLRNKGCLEFLELAAYDGFIRMAPRLSTEEPKITLIEISEKDIHENGKWPMTDKTLAKALENLLKWNPCAIGLDIYRDIPVPPGSKELNDIISGNHQVVGVRTFGEMGVQPPAIICNTDQVGFNDILVDPGGVVRRALLFLDDGNNVYTSFAFRLASRYLQAKGVSFQADSENPQYIRLGNTTVKPFEADDGGYVNADARGYQFLMDYKDSAVPFRSYSLMKLLAGEVPPEAITGKIILIGVSAQSVKDSFYTPLSRFEEAQQVPGVVLHGYIVSQLLRFAFGHTSPITSIAESSKAFWVLFWCFAGCVIGFWTRSALRFSLMLVCGLAVLFFCAYYAFLCRCWVPLVPPALSFFLSTLLVTALMSCREKKERALLMQLFSRHVSKEIAEVIWEQRDQFMNNGRLCSQKMTVTVFFFDLRDFTSMAEKMDSQELIDWLNTYVGSMTRLIMDHGGVIDDYAGDGIKANFGVPLCRNNEDDVRMDAVNAISCALAMEKEMYRLNAHWNEKGLPAMRTRIGIFTGTVVTGLLGSSERLKYTTVGDTVNVAARLESYDKEVCKDAVCRILIGDATLHYVNHCFITENIGEVNVKGKDERITVHRVLGEGDSGIQPISQEVSQCTS